MKITLIDFGDDTEGTFLFWKRTLLLDNCEFSTVNPDLALTSVFGQRQFSSNLKRIFINSENPRRWNWFPYNDNKDAILWLVANTPEDYPMVPLEKMCYAPYFLFNPFPTHPKRRPSRKEKFCCIVVSNQDSHQGCVLRELFMRELSKYKKVDSAGRALNNVGYLAPKDIEYMNWINQYKFMITFENSYGHGWVTEKIYNGFHGGAVPIYWGDIKMARHFFDEKAFVSLEGSIQQTLDRVIYLDNNDAEYDVMNNIDPFLPTIEERRTDVLARVKQTLSSLKVTEKQ